MGIFAFIQAVGRGIVAIGRAIAKLARWISMTLFWLVLAVIVFGSVFLAADFSNTPYQAPPVSAINAWITTVGIGIVLLLLFYGARLIKITLMAPAVWNVFGATPAVRFLGLGAVTLIYPKAIYSIVTVPIMVFGRMFSTLFTTVARPAGGADVRSVKSFAGTVEQMASQLANLMYVLFTEATAAAGQILERVLLSESIVALALWVLIGQLLGTTSPLAGAAGTARIRIVAYLQELGGIHRRNLALGLVFLGGIFLSIAAIVAIPALHEEKLPENLASAKLEATLNAILQPTSAKPAEQNPPETARKDPFTPMLEALNTATSKATKLIPVANTGAPKDVFVDVNRIHRDMVLANFQLARDQLTNAQSNRTWAIDQRESLRAQIGLERAQIVRIATTAYEDGLLGPLTNIQRGNYFSDIRRSVQFYLNQSQRALQTCDQALTSIDTRATQAASELVTRLPVLDGSALIPGFAGQAVHKLAADLAQFAYDAATRCSALEARPPEFNPPEAGAGWGPFATVSRWLVRTQSQALALITGMLGFGLLGSVIARYIRGMKQDEGIQGEVAVIVVRGLSAAIVVFLAVKGGLAIVSTADAEPNAYVLFFTCLVGAVYSEDVWEWARRSFNEKFKGKRDDAEQKAPDAPKAPSEAAPQATP